MSDDRIKWAALAAVVLVALMIFSIPILAILFPVLIVLIAEAPWLLAGALMLGFVGLTFVGLMATRSGYLPGTDDEETEEVDPLTTLQDRYAAGEISEAEFEHQVERILETDEIARRSPEFERSSARDRQSEPEREFERE